MHLHPVVTSLIIAINLLNEIAKYQQLRCENVFLTDHLQLIDRKEKTGREVSA